MAKKKQSAVAASESNKSSEAIEANDTQFMRCMIEAYNSFVTQFNQGEPVLPESFRGLAANLPKTKPYRRLREAAMFRANEIELNINLGSQFVDGFALFPLPPEPEATNVCE